MHRELELLYHRPVGYGNREGIHGKANRHGGLEGGQLFG